MIKIVLARWLADKLNVDWEEAVAGAMVVYSVYPLPTDDEAEVDEDEYAEYYLDIPTN